MTEHGLPLFPVTVVGSWSRPSWLLDALRTRQGGRMTAEEFDRVADQAVLEALRYQEDAGVDIVSDGEQRRDNFHSFVADKLDGVKLLTLAEIMDLVEDRAAYERALKAADAPAFSIKNETVVDTIRPRRPLALDEFMFLRQHTRKPIMVPLPGPYILARSMWVKGVSDKAYPTREHLAVDVVKVLRDELVALRDAGCAFVQFDEPVLTDVVFNRDVKERTFMCGSMAESTGDPSRELLFATRLLNSVAASMRMMSAWISSTPGGRSVARGRVISSAVRAPIITQVFVAPTKKSGARSTTTILCSGGRAARSARAQVRPPNPPPSTSVVVMVLSLPDRGDSDGEDAPSYGPLSRRRRDDGGAGLGPYCRP